ncbi:MAG: type II CRISPR RNA-guided endonuclease Cas9 [Armatimonadota bacterium]
MKYVLGLDIGINSVGWGVLNLDKNRIEDLGVRAFNPAEEPKTKSSLAAPRREARGARRRIRRRAGRMKRAKDLFVKYNLISNENRESVFTTSINKPTPWELRVKGLDNILTGEELARALFHIVKRRGFKSNRKKVKSGNKDDGKVLEAINQNKLLLEKYRTVGEFFQKDEKFAQRKRNTTDSYSNCVERSMLEQEIKTLFECQRNFGSKFAGVDFENEFLDIFNWQLPYTRGEMIDKLLGKCTFEQDEKRAPKHCYTVEYFDLLHNLNNISYSVNGDSFTLTQEEKQKIIDYAHEHAIVKFSNIRKLLNLPDDARFKSNQVDYLKKKKTSKSDIKQDTASQDTNPEPDVIEDVKTAENKKFFSMVGYHQIKSSFSEHGVWDDVKDDTDKLDFIAYILTVYKTDEDIKEKLTENGYSQKIIDAVLNTDGLTKTSHLSLKALKNILPFMKDGLRYDEAVEKAGYNNTHSTKSKLLPLIDTNQLTNPVVVRSLCQARRVINAVIKRYGSPYRIHIELARDMGKSGKERSEIEKKQKENKAENERMKEEMKAIFNRDFISGTDLLKYRLYNEQGGKCAYSQKPMALGRLFEPGYAEIDHILPYSKTFIDSRANKVLVFASENQNKRNRIPYEYIYPQGRWNEFEAWVRSVIKDRKKRDNLLMKELKEDGYIDRNLNDTRYICRYLSNFLKSNLLFDNQDGKQTVVTVNGQVTAKVRHLWGLEKNRDESDLHHAMDAIVVATVLPYQIKMLTEYYKTVETRQTYTNHITGEKIEAEKPRLPMPWKNFRHELLARLSENPAEEIAKLNLPSYDDTIEVKPIIVSRMLQKKYSGAIHEETIRSAKRVESDGISTVRKSLVSLTMKDLNNLVAKEADPPLYEAIVKKMKEHNGKADVAFAEGLRKPLKEDDGTGPIVRSVKLFTTQKSGFPVRGGIADNGDMVRVDIFKKDNKYYLVPVYVKDMMEGKLPNKAIAANKPEEQWPVIDDSYEFQYTLHPYDLVKLKGKNAEYFGYYRGTHRGTSALSISVTNNNQILIDGIGARKLVSIEKYEIDPLGEYWLVEKEKRLGLEDYSNLEPGETEA